MPTVPTALLCVVTVLSSRRWDTSLPALPLLWRQSAVSVLGALVSGRERGKDAWEEEEALLCKTAQTRRAVLGENRGGPGLRIVRTEERLTWPVFGGSRVFPVPCPHTAPSQSSHVPWGSVTCLGHEAASRGVWAGSGLREAQDMMLHPPRP